MPNHKPQRCTSGLMAVLKRADHGDLVLQSEVNPLCCRSQELLNSQQALLIQSGKASPPAAVGSPLRCCPAERLRLRQAEAVRPVGIAPARSSSIRKDRPSSHGQRAGPQGLVGFRPPTTGGRRPAPPLVPGDRLGHRERVPGTLHQNGQYSPTQRPHREALQSTCRYADTIELETITGRCTPAAVPAPVRY
jgi:hypothetical protein